MTKFIQPLTINGQAYRVADINQAAKLLGHENANSLPKSHKVLFENLLRHYDADRGDDATLQAFFSGNRSAEIPYKPARVLMQDFTCVML
jgi:aconitate hydratase